MKQYLDLAQKILTKGELRPNRTGTPAISLFGERMEFDLQEGFPLLTTKRINLQAVAAELLWFLHGKTNINDLPEKFRFIWEPWANQDGDCGPIYGSQWRNWHGFDQLQDVIDRIQLKPLDRRLLVSAWNVDDLNKMALPPCHVIFQFYVRKGEFLDLQMYQRSCDFPVGVPFNIASYALLLGLVAAHTGLRAGRFIHILGDVHIYENQIEGIKKQLEREPRPLPDIKIPYPNFDLFKLELDEIQLEGYDPHPFIKFEVAV